MGLGDYSKMITALLQWEVTGRSGVSTPLPPLLVSAAIRENKNMEVNHLEGYPHIADFTEDFCVFIALCISLTLPRTVALDHSNMLIWLLLMQRPLDWCLVICKRGRGAH